MICPIRLGRRRRDNGWDVLEVCLDQDLKLGHVIPREGGGWSATAGAYGPELGVAESRRAAVQLILNECAPAGARWPEPNPPRWTAKGPTRFEAVMRWMNDRTCELEREQ